MRTSQLVMHWYQKTIRVCEICGVTDCKDAYRQPGGELATRVHWDDFFFHLNLHTHRTLKKTRSINLTENICYSPHVPTYSNLIDCITGPSLQSLHDSLPLKIKRNSFFGNSTASRESTCVWHRYRRELSSPSRRAKNLNKGQSNLCHISYCWNSPTLNLKPYIMF